MTDDLQPGTAIVPLLMSEEIRDDLLADGGSSTIVPMRLVPRGYGFELVVREAGRWDGFSDEELFDLTEAFNVDADNPMNTQIKAELERRRTT